MKETSLRNDILRFDSDPLIQSRWPQGRELSDQAQEHIYLIGILSYEYVTGF